MRSRTSREEWARRVADWRRSGLPARRFAAREGINHHTLSHWAWRLGEERRGGTDAARGPRFIEIVGALADPAEASSEDGQPALPAAELVLRDGLRLRLALPADERGAKVVATLVAALEAR